MALMYPAGVTSLLEFDDGYNNQFRVGSSSGPCPRATDACLVNGSYG